MESTPETPGPAPVRIELLQPGSEAKLQEVFEAAGDYFLPLTGHPLPHPDAAGREIRECGATPGREIALLRSGTGEPVGAVGWWQGHPEPDIALLGMLMIVPAVRGQGLARAALHALEERLANQGVLRLRAGIGSGNPGAQQFALALGFRDLDDRRHVSLDAGRLMISLWEREINAP